MNELITIIVPVYKVEDYLNRCVDSILRQTYRNLEIILVDDGSPDRCGEICDEYAELDRRVKVIHKENGGLSDARNVGIDIAQGSYISFIDSDDWIHDEYIERLYQLIRTTNSDISVCNFLRVSTEILADVRLNEEIYEFSNLAALKQFTDKFYEQMVIACGKLFKKKLFEQIHFPVGRLHEDEFTTYKLIYNARKIVLTTAQLLYYWQREDSIMGSCLNIKSRFHAIDAFKERAEFLKDIGLEESSNETYKKLFIMCLEINRRINEIDHDINKEYFHNDFKELRSILRKNKNTLKFKVFYELYFIAPKITDLCLKLYVGLKRKYLNHNERNIKKI